MSVVRVQSTCHHSGQWSLNDYTEIQLKWDSSTSKFITDQAVTVFVTLSTESGERSYSVRQTLLIRITS